MKKKLGIALGSGSARGWAHIGVLNALSESGLQAEVIAGTSIGSVVGAVYSIGKLEEFEGFARALTWKSIVSLIDITFPGSGLIPGKRVFRMLSEYFREYKIEALPVPYCAVAADVNTGEEIRMRSGSVSDAVRASVAIPGIFTPFRHRGRILVDGGIVNPVPVNIVKDMGADIVIGVDLNSCMIRTLPEGPPDSRENGNETEEISDREWRIFEMLEEKYREISGSIREKIDTLRSKDHVPNILEIIDNATHIMQKSISSNQFRTSPPDVLLQPRLGDFRLLDFDRADEAIGEGYRVMMEKISEVSRLLEK